MPDIEKSVTAVEIREIFQNQQDNLVNNEGRKVIISHLGTFSQDLVDGLSVSAEEMLKSSGDNRVLVKRMFSILIEGLQNIRLHGGRDEQDRQVGYLIVARSNETYKVKMANIIDLEDYQKVEKYMEQINHLSEEKLKEKYIAVLTNEFLSQKGGAGLGFITTRMKSRNPLKYSFYSLQNDKMLFTFEVNLNRA